MALKQMDALAALREAAGEVIETSLCDVQGNWLAPVSYTHLTLPTNPRV